MSDHSAPDRHNDTPFDQILAESGTEAAFSTVFRGYDRDEVDAVIRSLTLRAEEANDQIAELKQYQRRASAAIKQTQEKAEQLEAQLAAALAEAAESEEQETIARLEGELTVALAKLDATEKQIQTLTDELKGASEEGASRPQFEEVLRVAEDQASVIISNASLHGERLLEGARQDAEKYRQDAQTEADTIRLQAQHDAQQARLKIETELTAHDARIEREAAHAAEKVAQAEREAAAIRSEAEKGAAALRSLVTRETAQQRSEAEDTVRELQMRAMEFEASLTRRQDDAQQEFLVLHNQAVAHAERITNDANEQVAASLEHAKRVSAKADDFEQLMRAQAQQIEADANVRARERLDAAHTKAQHILDLVSSHAQSVLRDAEDRTRQLRWQQHELTSFMTEVKELMRVSTPLATDAAPTQSDGDLDAELAELTAQADDTDDVENVSAAGVDEASSEVDDASDADAVEEAADADQVDEADVDGSEDAASDSDENAEVGEDSEVDDDTAVVTTVPSGEGQHTDD